MTRTMYDAVNVAAMPAGVDMVAGYIDGRYVTMPAVRARYPRATLVEIAVRESTNAGHVFDTEPGNPTPPAAIRWVAMRRRAGFATPAVYTMRAWWQWCRDECARQGVPEPLWWIAEWNTPPRPVMIPGAIAHQYGHPGNLGVPYDLSIVADHWPGVDTDPIPPAPPAPKRKAHEMLVISIVTESPQRHYAYMEGLDPTAPGALWQLTDQETIDNIVAGAGHVGWNRPQLDDFRAGREVPAREP